MNSYELLLNQIDAFIRKYYKNQLLKGLFLAFLVLLISFLLVTILEYFGRFNSLIRATLFFTFISVNAFITYTYLLIPLFKLFSFGKRISRKQAAVIIGDFFPQISDRLLNTIQLHDTLAIEGGNYELIKASIAQRSQTISAIPFVNGIDLKKNLVYFKYLGPVFAVFLAIAIFSPSIITQGSKRVVNYSKEFKMEAPFDFIPTNLQTQVAEGEDVSIEVKTIGEILPEKVYLVSSTGKYLMHKSSRILNSYIIPRVSKGIDFHFEANGFTSDAYHIEMLPKSAIGTFDAFLHYPSYIGKKDVLVQNAGDLEIPEGTVVTWKVKSKNTELITMDWKDDRDYFKETDFQVSKRFVSSKRLTVLLKNPRLAKLDSLFYAIQVVKDAQPAIQVQEQKDSISDAIRYFDGLISDDYGLRKLQFVYTIFSTEGKPITKKVDVFNPAGTEMQFSHAVDFRREKTKWFEQQHLKNTSNERLAEIISQNSTEKYDLNTLTAICGLMKERATFPDDILKEGAYLLARPTEFEAQTVSKKWNENAPALMREWTSILESISTFDAPTIEATFKAFLTEKNLGIGAVLPLFRLLLTGVGMGPSMFDIATFLGKEEVVERMKVGMELLS